MDIKDETFQFNSVLRAALGKGADYVFLLILQRKSKYLEP